MKPHMTGSHWGEGRSGIVTHPQFTDEETETYRHSVSCLLASSVNLQLNRASRNHENELALCCSGEGKSVAGQGALRCHPSYCFAPCLISKLQSRGCPAGLGCETSFAAFKSYPRGKGKAFHYFRDSTTQTFPWVSWLFLLDLRKTLLLSGSLWFLKVFQVFF